MHSQKRLLKMNAIEENYENKNNHKLINIKVTILKLHW